LRVRDENLQQQVTDETLELVVRDGNVYQLAIRSNQVTNAGLLRLVGAHELRCLSIRSEQITDAGIAELCRLPLRSVRICSPSITREGLSSFRRLTTLKKLEICGDTQISKKEFDEFERARPDIYLSIEPLADWRDWQPW